MAKWNLQLKVLVIGFVLALPYLISHFFISGRNDKIIRVIKNDPGSVQSTPIKTFNSITFMGLETAGSGPYEQPLKKILFWNKVKRAPYYYFGPGREPFLRAGCRVNTCTITENRSLYHYEDLDAVVWHVRSKDTSLPKERSPHTRFVFMMMEPPGHVHVQLLNFRNVFNWTLTYRVDADMFMPVMRILKKNLNDKEREVFNYAAGKTKMAAWFVSNCNTENGRSRLAKTLQKYINIDVYGKCGPLSCPRSRSQECYTMLERDYKFYLSFENSLCKDYITEKFFRIMQLNVLPIVYGGGNYSLAAPPHSYISVFDFSSVGELAEYLQYLDGNDTAYNEYFWWKRFYRVVPSNLSRAMAWCNLCERLHHDATPKVYHNIHKWYIQDAKCTMINKDSRLRNFVEGRNDTQDLG